MNALHNFLEVLTVLCCQPVAGWKLRKFLQHTLGLLYYLRFEINHLTPSSFFPRAASGIPLRIHQCLFIANSLEYPGTLDNPIQALLSQRGCLLVPESLILY